MGGLFKTGALFCHVFLQSLPKRVRLSTLMCPVNCCPEDSIFTWASGCPIWPLLTLTISNNSLRVRAAIIAGSSYVDESIPWRAEIVIQRLKPQYECGVYGTAEAVPLSKTGI
jgi:hypothetical protein